MGAVLDLVRVLFEPTAVFERVREKPRFLAPFVALAIILVLVSVVQLPYIKTGLSAQFSQMPNMPPEAAQRAMSFASIGIAVTHKTSKGGAYTAAIAQLLVTLLVTGALSGLRGGR